jgi:hypothetical protein
MPKRKICCKCKFWTRCITTSITKIGEIIEPYHQGILSKYSKLVFPDRFKYEEVLKVPIVHNYGECRFIANAEKGVLLEDYFFGFDEHTPEWEKLSKTVKTSEHYGCIHYQSIE